MTNFYHLFINNLDLDGKLLFCTASRVIPFLELGSVKIGQIAEIPVLLGEFSQFRFFLDGKSIFVTHSTPLSPFFSGIALDGSGNYIFSALRLVSQLSPSSQFQIFGVIQKSVSDATTKLFLGVKLDSRTFLKGSNNEVHFQAVVGYGFNSSTPENGYFGVILSIEF